MMAVAWALPAGQCTGLGYEEETAKRSSGDSGDSGKEIWCGGEATGGDELGSSCC